MNLFEKLTLRADIINEARISKFEQFFQYNRLAREIETKQLGLARPIAFQFIVEFLRDKGLIPEDVKFGGSRYAADVGDFLKKLIEQGLISTELAKEFDEYIDQNFSEFLGIKQQLRTRGKGEMVGKTFETGEDFKQYKQIRSKEEFNKQQAEAMANRKEELRAERSPIDTERVDLAELKSRLMVQIEHPGIKNTILDHLLDTEIDDPYDAEEMTDSAIETVSKQIRTARSGMIIFDVLENLIDRGNTAESMLATAVFNVLKKIIPAFEDEEELDPREGDYGDFEQRQQEADDRGDRRKHWSVDREAEIASVDFKAPVKRPTKGPIRSLRFESTRQKFKPKNIHQLIQQERDGWGLY